MHLHLLLLTTFLCTVLAQEGTSKDVLVGQGGRAGVMTILGQPDQQQNKPKHRKKSNQVGKQQMYMPDEDEYEDEDGYESIEPSLKPKQPSAISEAESSSTPFIESPSPYTEAISSTEKTEDPLVSDTPITTSPETSSTNPDKTTTVTTTHKPPQNVTVTPKPAGSGKSIWKSPLVIWIAIIVLTIIVLGVQMPTILYLLCCRNQTQTSEVLLSDGKDFQGQSRSQSVNQAQTVTQQQLKSSAAPPMAPVPYNTGKSQTAAKFLPTLGAQQQQRQNDTAAMSDAFGTSMNSDAESGFANAPVTSAAIKAKAHQMLPKISYTATNDQKISSTSAKRNQVGKSNGKSKKAASRK